MAGAQSQAMLEKMELRQSYRNVWHTDLTNAVAADLPWCCLSLWCGPCVSYMLRRRALYNDMSRYVCCAGYMPCSGKCGESQCPEVCLATEDEFNIQTTQCDNCIIAFMFFLQQLACICSLVACIVGNSELSEVAHLISCMSNLVYWTVCSCMQTQHKVEMDKRDGTLNTMSAPPMQQMSRF